MRQRLLVMLLLVLLAGVACNSKPVIPTASPLSPLTSPLLTATSQPTAMPTPKETPTPTPWSTLTATALPTLAPTPVGVVPPPGLIYKTRDGLWRVNADGESVRLLDLGADHMSFVLSPEGDRVLYWDWNEGDIWLGDLRTGETKNLTNTPTQFECCPEWWLSAETRILFGSLPIKDWGNTVPSLLSMELDTREIFIIGDGAFIPPAAVSPDGQTVAYSRGGPMLYRAATGVEPFELATYGITQTKAWNIGGPAWSPDGKSIAWTVSSFNGNTQKIGAGVFNLHERNWRLYHPYEPVGRGGQGYSSVIWSPDSEWLVMRVDTRNPASGKEEVSYQVIRIGGGRSKEYAVDPGPFVWSPDSKHFISNHSLIEVGTWRAQPLALPLDAEVVAWIDLAPQ